MNRRFGLYSLLNRGPFRHSLASKCSLVAVVLMLPTVVLLALTAWWPEFSNGLLLLSVGSILLTSLAAPRIFESLLSPLDAARTALSRYADSRVTPDLPGNAPDLAGQLMAGIQQALVLAEQTRKSQDVDTATDPLTGLLNRRSATRRMGSDLLRSIRDGRSFCVAAIEVENAAELQQQFGNDAMDDVAKVLARRISDPLRRSDWVAHLGNTDFLVGLWGAELEESRKVMQRVIETVDGQTRVPVVLNVGVARAREGHNPDRLTALAINAVTRARRQPGSACEIENDTDSGDTSD